MSTGHEIHEGQSREDASGATHKHMGIDSCVSLTHIGADGHMYGAHAVVAPDKSQGQKSLPEIAEDLKKHAAAHPGGHFVAAGDLKTWHKDAFSQLGSHNFGEKHGYSSAADVFGKAQGNPKSTVHELDTSAHHVGGHGVDIHVKSSTAGHSVEVHQRAPDGKKPVVTHKL